MTMKYKVHRFNLKMTSNQRELEEFLNNMRGEIVSIIPNVSFGFGGFPRVDFLLIVEKVA
jgi:hypothetical protein